MNVYKVATFQGKLVMESELLETELNKIASEGWELVSNVRDLGIMTTIWKKNQ